MSNIKRYIILGLGVIVFIIGFSLTSFIVWVLLNDVSQGVIPETVHSPIDTMIVGLALVVIGMIVILLTKIEKNT